MGKVTRKEQRSDKDATVARSFTFLHLDAVPNGYPNPTRYPVFFPIPDPIQF